MLPLALLVFGLLQAPGATPEQNDVRKRLEHFETEWNVAHVRGDAAALHRIFSDEAVVIVPGMRVMTKADALDMFTSGRMSETTFRILDDTAIETNPCEQWCDDTMTIGASRRCTSAGRIAGK